MLYNEPLYRPPSEANSAIVQVTLGCSWNQCDTVPKKCVSFKIQNFEKVKTKN